MLSWHYFYFENYDVYITAVTDCIIHGVSMGREAIRSLSRELYNR